MAIALQSVRNRRCGGGLPNRLGEAEFHAPRGKKVRRRWFCRTPCLERVIDVSTIGPVRIVTSACSKTKPTTRSATARTGTQPGRRQFRPDGAPRDADVCLCAFAGAPWEQTVPQRGDAFRRHHGHHARLDPQPGHQRIRTIYRQSSQAARLWPSFGCLLLSLWIHHPAAPL
jgi:hypothetical protein